MTSLLHKLSLQKAADKHGPRSLLVANIGPYSVKCVLLSRTGQKVAIEDVATISIDNEDGESDFKEICKKSGLKSRYCSIILKERDEQVRLLRVPNKISSPSDVSKFIAETFGSEKESLSSYQFVGPGNDSSEKLMIAGLLNKEKSADLRKSVEVAGLKPVSLGLESVALINMAFDLSQDDTLRAFLYVGDISSILIVTKGQNLKFVRPFPHGKNCIVESLMNGL